jgi:hypothetical protein
MPVHLDGFDAYLLMLPTGPVLPQVQVLDLLGHPAHLQPSLAQLLFDPEGLHFGEELVDLHRCGLALLVESPEVVNLSHVSPVILGKGLKSSAKHGECGGGTHECGEEPC